MKTETLIDLDNLVKEGKIDLASQALKEAPLPEIPRSEWPLFANLAWRVGLGELGIRLISPLIREKNLRDAPTE